MAGICIGPRGTASTAEAVERAHSLSRLSDERPLTPEETEDAIALERYLWKLEIELADRIAAEASQ